MFRNLSDNSLNNLQVEKLREEILSKSDEKILVAYFSYSGYFLFCSAKAAL